MNKTITFEQFEVAYRPIINTKAALKGAMIFPIEDIAFYYDKVQEKRIWTLLSKLEIIDIITNLTIQKDFIVPGFQQNSTVRGYLITELPFENYSIQVELN